MVKNKEELPTKRETTLTRVKEEMDEPRLVESVRKVLEGDSLAGREEALSLFC